MNNEEWFERCEVEGTAEDMVYDILKDWKKESKLLLKGINMFAGWAGFGKYNSVKEFLKKVKLNERVR